MRLQPEAARRDVVETIPVAEIEPMRRKIADGT
jgi:hypothetical protein